MKDFKLYIMDSILTNPNSKIKVENLDFQYSFLSAKKAETIFNFLKDVNNWWTGIYNETIVGTSDKINHEFRFSAGEGMHFSRHRLTTFQPYHKIEWQVIESVLSFVQQRDEWTGTSFGFQIEEENLNRRITFFHKGLNPQFECYSNCSSAWQLYMTNLENNLK